MAVRSIWPDHDPATLVTESAGKELNANPSDLRKALLGFTQLLTYCNIDVVLGNSVLTLLNMKMMLLLSRQPRIRRRPSQPAEGDDALMLFPNLSS